MNKYVYKAEYRIGDWVYVKTDNEQTKRMCTGVYFRPDGVSYILSVDGNEQQYYGVELSIEEDALTKIL